MVWNRIRVEDDYTRKSREAKELIDRAEKGDLGYRDRKVSIMLFIAFIGAGIAVFLLIRDMFDKWYLPALITMIPAIVIPIVIHLIIKKRNGY